MAAGIFTYGFGLTTWRAMTEKTRDEVLAEYEAAARRSSALGHRWEQMVLIEPLRPGDHEPTITREQIELEDAMLAGVGGLPHKAQRLPGGNQHAGTGPMA